MSEFVRSVTFTAVIDTNKRTQRIVTHSLGDLLREVAKLEMVEAPTCVCDAPLRFVCTGNCERDE